MPGRSTPREASPLETRIPPPLVLLACGGLAWALSQVAATRWLLPGAIAMGTALVLLGVAFNVVPKLAFRRAGTTVNPLRPGRTVQLVCSGLHRRSRNPMYLGHALILLGLALALRNASALLAVPAYMLYITRYQVVPEERALLERFGREYERYRSQVRRWL